LGDCPETGVKQLGEIKEEFKNTNEILLRKAEWLNQSQKKLQ
jgi:hypothetical protein